MVTFAHNNGSEYVDFDRRKIEMQISAPLIETFPGTQPVPGVPGDSASIVQTTQVADSSRYYSIQPVSANITAGDLTIKAESVYAPLVPSRSRLEESWTTCESARKVARQVSDDTAGGWRGVVGAIDYQTGDFAILALGQYSYPEYTIKYASKSGYIYKLSSTYTSKTQTFNGDAITAIAQSSDLNHTRHSESISSPEL